MKKWMLLCWTMAFCLLLSAQPSNSFKFAVVTDTHVGSATGEEDLRRTVKDLNSLTDIAFVIVSGDLTEFGAYDELLATKTLLDSLNVPYYSIPGNHDANWSESGTNDFLRIFVVPYKISTLWMELRLSLYREM